jgi:anti-sigma regulatory factor (Ser/Thr protein kinase)
MEDFPPKASSPRLARRWAREHIRAWAPDRDSDEALLLVSELVTNSVIHAHTALTVQVGLADDCLHVEVADGDPRLPAAGSPSQDAASGRGLMLVSRIADAWGARTAAGGKVVWFDLHLAAV